MDELPSRAPAIWVVAGCAAKDLDEWYNFRGLGGLRPSWLESNFNDAFSGACSRSTRRARRRLTALEQTALTAGDSGGPLFCAGRITGVVSCSVSRKQPVLDLVKVCARVDSAQSFIENTLTKWK